MLPRVPESELPRPAAPAAQFVPVIDAMLVPPVARSTRARLAASRFRPAEVAPAEVGWFAPVKARLTAEPWPGWARRMFRGWFAPATAGLTAEPWPVWDRRMFRGWPAD